LITSALQPPPVQTADAGTYETRLNGNGPLTIRDLPQGERPRERLRHSGAKHLSNGELIAILFRTGLEGENVLALATRVLARAGGLSGLARTSYESLCAEKGVSDAKACQLLAALELGRRVAALAPDDRAKVGGPEDIARMFMGEMSALDREHLRVVLLNIKNEVVAVDELYVGNVSSTQVRPAEVFAQAVRRSCPAVAIVHNHPSGDPTPSDEDVAITQRIRAAGKLLDVELVDHVIIGQGRFVSMRQQGKGFPPPEQQAPGDSKSGKAAFTVTAPQFVNGKGLK
jgi:DNA repair protein RadC